MLLISITGKLLPPSLFFFFNDTATTEIYTLSLHDALPIANSNGRALRTWCSCNHPASSSRSEEHTSELQSLAYLVCRLLLEKKKNIQNTTTKKKKKQKKRSKTIWTI